MILSDLRKIFAPRRRAFQRAPEIVFNRSRVGLAPSDSGIQAAEGPRLQVMPVPRHTERLARHFEYSPSELAALNIDLAPTALVSITGSDSRSYLVDLVSEASCDDVQQARALLERVSLTREGGTLVLRNPPPDLPGVRCRSFLDILTPAGQGVVLTGGYSIVQFFAIRAPVTVVTSHCSLSFFDNSGAIDAISSNGGSIALVGTEGRARLDADLDINLKVTATTFRGTLEAIANGTVRLLIPSAFTTGIEAQVRSNSLFVCRSGIRSQFRRSRHGGMRTFGFGEGRPQLRLVSRHGSVVIDEIGLME
jgi:hypothetical protein